MNKKGFTLLEIIAVITIILVIAVIIVPIVDRNIKDAQNIASNSQVELFEQAAFIYAINYKNEIPELTTDKIAVITIETLLNKGLLEQKKLKTVKNETIPISNKIFIVLVENNIKTIYDKMQEDKPIIVLHGPKQITMSKNEGYNELGASVVTFSPNEVNELETANIHSGVNNTVAGVYEVTYSYPNANSIVRNVVVSEAYIDVDQIKPVIQINNSSIINLTKGSPYVEFGATATDNVDGNITSRIVISGTVNTNQKGTHYIKYDVTDSFGNKAVTAVRTIIIN